MTPTLYTNDHLLADMRSGSPLRRGEVIVFEAGLVTRIDRIAALPGDRIAIHNGVPIVNGQPAIQHFVGNLRYAGFDGTDSVRRSEERLPGEAGSHFILDLGTPSEIDEMAELWVPPGHVFVLGDNRDRAADSRVPLYMNGVGLPSLDDIRGRPLFIWWSGDHSRIGARINP